VVCAGIYLFTYTAHGYTCLLLLSSLPLPFRACCEGVVRFAPAADTCPLRARHPRDSAVLAGCVRRFSGRWPDGADAFAASLTGRSFLGFLPGTSGPAVQTLLRRRKPNWRTRYSPPTPVNAGRRMQRRSGDTGATAALCRLATAWTRAAVTWPYLSRSYRLYLPPWTYLACGALSPDGMTRVVSRHISLYPCISTDAPLKH